jgi:hypothetical protein
MCLHCDTLLRHVPLLQRNSAQEVELVALVADEIRSAHKFRPSTRKPPAVTMSEALRALESSAYFFYADQNQSNYNVIVANIAAFWNARAKANDARKSNILNPAGKPEPAHGPAHFTVPPDCFIHGKQNNDPARIVAHIDHARHAITRNNESAERQFAQAARLAKEGSVDAARLAREFAHDSVHRSNWIEYELTEFRSIHNARR